MQDELRLLATLCITANAFGCFNVDVFVFVSVCVYSQVHKYGGMDTIFLFFGALTTVATDLELNKQAVLLLPTFIFNLRVFTAKSIERRRKTIMYREEHFRLRQVEWMLSQIQVR